MATVFRARDIKHGRTVAVKLLHPELSEALGATRFLQEVRITARLSHPHILPLLDSGNAEGLLYYVMPFVDGESLRARLSREGPLSVPEAVRLTREIADALGYAHSQGIVHRDIKPENVLLLGGHAVVADFGIATVFDETLRQRLTETGIAVGTPYYMSPEQSSGERAVDGRSDIYALGCVAFEMLTGEPPYVGPSAMAITARKLTEDLPPLRARRPSVSAALARAVETALARSPADRFRTAHEFAAALAADAATAGGTTGEAAVSRPSARPSATWWMAVAALAVLGGSAWLMKARSTSADAPALTSVAVLPFESLGPDSTQIYVAEGLTDELITSLSMVEGIRVASRTSSAVLARQGLELGTIGTRLSVATVLEGSVRASRERVRISARLVTVADGYPVWTQTFERDATDLFRVQEEIAAAIVHALTGQLGAAQARAVSSGTTDAEAYDLYLQGRALRQRQTEQSLGRAVSLFRAAIAREPAFARAHAGLGEALAVIGFYEYERPRDVFPTAAQAAAEALRLDPRNAAAHATSAYVSLYYAWDLPEAERRFQRALAVEPNSAIAHQWYANFLTAARRFAEAEHEFRTALQLDPAAPVRRAALIWAQFYAGDAPRAVETYRQVIALDSSYALTFQWGAMALQQVGQAREALSAAERAVQLANRGTSFVAALAQAHAAAGDGATARRLLRDVESARVVPAYDVAKVHAMLGDRAATLHWLDRAFQQRSHSMVLLRIDPTFAAYRDDAAFQELVRRVGLP